ncbi:MAG: efflux RND transporter permease subunit, partial [Candidatus Omnitrophica bacterium]|nr:efflux RND transporter permease subunit [Candidatus Omnitrophota bacterium]
GKTINLIVIKKERADAVKLVKKVKEVVANFQKTAKDKLTVYTLNDLSIYLTRRLNILKNNGMIAIILVLSSLLLFLTRRVAFFTALGIPIAFAATLFFMFFVGMSINMITMFALILVLGMIVDDGIIIAENVYRHIENGVPPRQAAVIGTEEVIAPVTTTILTTIVAFLPLAFMTGMMGKFVRAIPVVVIVALIASLLEAFVILPSHLADFAKPYVKGSDKKIYNKKELPWFKSILNFYTGILTKAMNNRYKVIGFLFLFFIFICILVKLFVPIITFPQKGIEEFYIRAEAPIGTSLEKTSNLSKQLENVVAKIPKNELDSYLTTVGNIFEGRSHDPYTRRGSHLVQMNVFLTPQSERKQKSMDIVENLKPFLKDVKGFDKVYFEQIKQGPPQGKAVDIRIRGENFGVMESIAKEYMDYLKTIKGVINIETDYKFGKEEYNVIVDEKKAALAGLTVGQIAKAISNAYDGGVATYIRREKAEEEIDVRVRFSKEHRKDVSSFDKILVQNKYGNLIMLSKVASLQKSRQLEGINHLDGRRAIRVWANVDERIISPHKANSLVQKHFADDPTLGHVGFNITYRGEEKDIQESFGNLKKALLIALFLIFVILATNFNSLIQPVIVMFTILFGVIGAMIALLLHREAFSFMAFLGIVGMTGVVVNDCIVLVDFINRQRKEGKDRRQSIINSGRLRLRPVLLTTITTVLGLLPIAYGLGGKDQIIMPAALTMSFGLLFGTALTLIAIPCIYAIVDDITLKIVHHATVIRNSKGSIRVKK